MQISRFLLASTRFRLAPEATAEARTRSWNGMNLQGRELGLKRALLTLLGVAGVTPEKTR